MCNTKTVPHSTDSFPNVSQVDTLQVMHSQSRLPVQTATTKCDVCRQISEAQCKPPSLSRRGKVMLGVSGAVFAGISAMLLPFVSPGLRRIALPYIPATTAQVNNVVKALKGRNGCLVDIGSGDGRITIEAARRGFQASGVELNRWLVWYSRWSAWRQGLGSNTNFFRKDLWKTDLSPYNNIVVFGVETMMSDLELKMGKELTENTAVVACRFPLPNWTPDLTIGKGIDTVWLYITPASCNIHQSKDWNPGSGVS